MADLVVVYWKDIPAQVKARSGRRAVRRELPPRFAEAIDRAAMRSGERDQDAYLAQWRTGEPVAIDIDMQQAVDQLCTTLEAEWTDARLSAAVANGGRDA